MGGDGQAADGEGQMGAGMLTLQPKVTEELCESRECEGDWERGKESHREEKPRTPRTRVVFDGE